MDKVALWKSVIKGLGTTSEEEAKKLLNLHRRVSSTHGPSSFLADILTAPFSRKTKAKARNVMWKYVNEPALKTDIVAGHYLGKIPFAKKLFSMKEQVPALAKELKNGELSYTHKNLHQDVRRASALAPIAKLRNIAVPIIAGTAVSNWALKKGDKMARQQTDNPINLDLGTKDLREKVASTLLRLNTENKKFEKMAQAVKILYKQAEKGYEPFPETYKDFEQKLASLQNKDLVIFEKALDLSSGDEVKLGELAGQDPTSDPTMTFYASIID